MQTVKLSIAEIIRISKLAKEQGIKTGLPSSKPGVADKATREGWKFEIVPARGGKNGVKRIFTLPNDVIKTLQDNGLLNTIQRDAIPSKEEVPRQSTVLVDIPNLMQPIVAEYHTWATQQNTNAIVPIRYYTNMFDSASNNIYIIDISLNPQAMWFHTSLITYLNTEPQYCFCTPVRGDSMYPTLIDRGIVLWQMQNSYSIEGIYLFRQVNELRIKRLQRINCHTFRIISDNSNKDIYPTEILNLDEMGAGEFEIYGRYLWSAGVLSR